MAAKHIMKKNTIRQLDSTSFPLGSMVTIRILQLTGKLDDKWEGLYEVLGKVSLLNYRLAIPGKANHPMMLQDKMLKLWQNTDNKILWIFVTTDNRQDNPSQNLAVLMSALTPEEVYTLRAAGILESSRSPWSSPILPVCKKDSGIRLCSSTLEE